MLPNTLIDKTYIFFLICMLLPSAQLILLIVIVAGQFIASSLAPGAVIAVQSLNVRLRDALTQGREDFKERASAFFYSGITDYITFRGNISDFFFQFYYSKYKKNTRSLARADTQKVRVETK